MGRRMVVEPISTVGLALGNQWDKAKGAELFSLNTFLH